MSKELLAHSLTYILSVFTTTLQSQVKFILPQRYKHKTQAGNSERPHGHLSQPHPKQQLKFR